MTIIVPLPAADGRLAPYTLRDAAQFPSASRARSTASPSPPPTSSPIRCADIDPWLTPRSTGTRRSPIADHCGTLGLGVAEAMDTAQRGMGLDWPMALELIRRASPRRGPRRRADRARGAGTDQLDAGRRRHASTT